MTDIVAFLTARLDEMQARVRDDIEWWWENRQRIEVYTTMGMLTGGEQYIEPFIDPAHVLREIAAKRRILARHRLYGSGPTAMCDGCGDSDTGHPRSYRDECPELRDLAAIYAEHPDYDPAWRVE